MSAVQCHCCPSIAGRPLDPSSARTGTSAQWQEAAGTRGMFSTIPCQDGITVQHSITRGPKNLQPLSPFHILIKETFRCGTRLPPAVRHGLHNPWGLALDVRHILAAHPGAGMTPALLLHMCIAPTRETTSAPKPNRRLAPTPRTEPLKPLLSLQITQMSFAFQLRQQGWWGALTNAPSKERLQVPAALQP